MMSIGWRQQIVLDHAVRYVRQTRGENRLAEEGEEVVGDMVAVVGSLVPGSTNYFGRVGSASSCCSCAH
jgi:hypothetical protein